MHDGGTADLALLIHYVAAIDGVDRVRFFTSHPVEFTDSLIDAYRDVPELVSYLHLPVQSGSDRILSLMKRGHTRDDYIQKIEKLRAVRSNLSLSSDFIIGFPGEIEEDFQQTLSLIDEVGFDLSYSFIYSARPGTPAAELDDDVSLEEKKQRLATLQAKINHNAQQISRKMVGSVEKVLFEGLSKKSLTMLSGRTENNRIVHVKADASLIGEFVDVEITEALPNCLRGSAV
jgi:tRNA-2-methylthio-N6-dimethylallyladenosine synthase